MNSLSIFYISYVAILSMKQRTWRTWTREFAAALDLTQYLEKASKATHDSSVWWAAATVRPQSKNLWWGPKKVSRLNLQIEKYKLKVKEQEEPQKLWFLPTNAATWSNGASWQVDQLIKLKRLSVQRKNTNQEEKIKALIAIIHS